METPTCYRHEGRETGRSCTRCGRAACPDCLTPAPVGHHCAECLSEGRSAQVQRVRWRAPTRRGASTGMGPMVAGLLAVNIGVFLLQQVDRSIEVRFANIPFAVASGQYYRLLTAAFLHAGLFHLGLNMLTLVIVGREVESALGRTRFLALYLVSALGGSVSFYLFGSATALALGASTATFGLFGALFVVVRARRLDTRQIAMLIALNLFFGLVVPGIDNLGHVGGLVTGAAVAGAYELAARLRRPAQQAAQALAVIGVAALLATLVTERTPQAAPPVPDVSRPAPAPGLR